MFEQELELRQEAQEPDGRNCPQCGEPYEHGPDEDGVFDCGNCGVWTLSWFWEVRNDLDYTQV